MPRGCAKRTTPSIIRVDGECPSTSGSIWSDPGSERRSALAAATPVGRAVIDRQTIHIHDLAAEVETEFPGSRMIANSCPAHRTMLATPLLREGVPSVAIDIRRTEVRPFTDKQIHCLKPLPIRP